MRLKGWNFQPHPYTSKRGRTGGWISCQWFNQSWLGNEASIKPQKDGLRELPRGWIRRHLGRVVVLGGRGNFSAPSHKPCRLCLFHLAAPSKWRLLSPPLSLECRLRPPFPKWEPFSRTRPWERNVLLRPYGWYRWLNPIKVSTWTLRSWWQMWRSTGLAAPMTSLVSPFAS